MTTKAFTQRQTERNITTKRDEETYKDTKGMERQRQRQTSKGRDIETGGQKQRQRGGRKHTDTSTYRQR